MSTRSIIMVTGEDRHAATTRIYKHCDGYPSGALPVIAEAVAKAAIQVKETEKRFGGSSKIGVSQVVGLIIGADTSVHGMAFIDQDYDKHDHQTLAMYSEKLKPIHFGNQGDLEWIYVVDVEKQTIGIYGGGYDDHTPFAKVKKGVVDPLDDSDDHSHKVTQSAISLLNKAGFTLAKKAPKSAPKKDLIPIRKASKKVAKKTSKKMDTSLAVVAPSGVVTLPDNKTHFNRMEIKSESSDRIYIVSQSKNSNEWQCSCPGWIIKKPGRERGCKHLDAIVPAISAQKSKRLK